MAHVGKTISCVSWFLFLASTRAFPIDETFLLQSNLEISLKHVAIEDGADLSDVTEALLYNQSALVAEDLQGGTGEVTVRQSLGAWFEWGSRMPELAPAEPTAVDMASLLTYLGDQLWMQIVDGQFHSRGPHALDGNHMNEDFMQNGRVQYALFENASAWEAGWTADRLVQANANLGGFPCPDARCLNHYRQYGGHPQRPPERVTPAVERTQKTSAERLNSTLAAYYERVRPLRSLGRSSRLEQAMPILAALGVELGRLHPFIDANSRTRLFVIQTELVRLGGHPIILWDHKSNYGLCRPEFAKGASDTCSPEAVDAMQDLYLDGWCAWESLVTTGVSPFQSGGHRKNYDNSTGVCL